MIAQSCAATAGRNDINVVPMIDMMIILVFFLIFTAVFTKTNILELNLPAPNSRCRNLPKGLEARSDRARRTASRSPIAVPAC